jgi:hydroxymethylbilane synthase
MNIKIGTRASQLALWQAYHIQQKLQNHGIVSEIIPIETKGDKILDRALSKIGSKGVFTEELEVQLHDGTIDIAVHSAKDLQSDLGEGLEILAFTDREKPNDVLISLNKNLDLKSKIIVGTSSTRRVAMLKAYYPNFQAIDIRGNLQTRIRKMEEGHCDALLLAFAGVNRMEYQSLIVHEFDTRTFVPPVGQGSVAVEVSTKIDTLKAELIRKACNHVETEKCLLIERSFLKQLQGGCSIPVFGHAYTTQEGIRFTAGIISLDGHEIVQENLLCDHQNYEEFGKNAAIKMLSIGGKEILEGIKSKL